MPARLTRHLKTSQNMTTLGCVASFFSRGATWPLFEVHLLQSSSREPSFWNGLLDGCLIVERDV